ncbi:aminotransferase [Natronospira proteinivora]|uniref:Aminotransferase n=1 Tax=Natronospira proteinivora TaxID=1807133 RepID=A0ABT1GAD6_9GAMM|nr:pyridoxal phosphate-dependent aminotransferase [Natronospira proteinivora]MCP1726892.1 aminotransferase [Natronospira proteinivora]
MLERIRSERVAHLVQSDIRAMTQRCVEVNGVNMGQGICDTPPPGEVIQGVTLALEKGANRYTRYDGVKRLRHALSERLARDNTLNVDPETEVVVTVGSTGAFAATVTALCNPGDRILLFEPYYGYHLNTARVAGLEVDMVPLNPADFTLDEQALEAKAKGARAIVVNTPGNPSGRVFTRDELTAIAQICQRHDLLCITDEIYEYFLYDDHAHISMATLPGMKDRTVTISGYSKTFSITGWRIGFVAAPRELAEPIGLVNDMYYVCAPSPLQYAVADTIQALDPDFYQSLAREYQAKRDRFCQLLDQVGLTPRVPEGAYYVLADISRLGCETSHQAAMTLLEEAGVATVPGSAFFSGPDGEHWTRFCFGRTDKTLEAAERQLLEWAERSNNAR